MLKEYFDDAEYKRVKKSDNLMYKALEIVNELFENDFDKGGYPYIIHLMQVYKNVDSYDGKVVALLHDTLEDKNVTEEELIEIGFPEKIAQDVKILTRNKIDEYQLYIDKLLENGSKEALEVKLSDLKNNLDLTRIKNPTEADFERVEKRYKPAYEKINNKLEEMEKKKNDRHKPNKGK